MRTDVAVRSAALADAACLAALGSQVWLHTYAKSGIRPAIARYVHENLSPAAFRHQLERSDAIALVAEVDGSLVGSALVEFDKPCVARSPASTHLDKLYVQEYFIGTGIGRALLTQVRAQASHRAASSALWLTVNSQNLQARAFYTRQGFTDIGCTNFDLYGELHENRILHVLDA
jgi:GNAT superfamily N-acetyltransferase